MVGLAHGVETEDSENALSFDVEPRSVPVMPPLPSQDLKSKRESGDNEVHNMALVSTQISSRHKSGDQCLDPSDRTLSDEQLQCQDWPSDFGAASVSDDSQGM